MNYCDVRDPKLCDGGGYTRLRDGRSCCRGCYSKHSDYWPNIVKDLRLAPVTPTQEKKRP